MLFNSYLFIFLFFPCSLVLFFGARRCGRNAQLLVMLAASIVFYGWWDVRFLALLGGSILANFTFGRLLATQPAARRRRWLLAAGVTLNLGVLSVFKYANFFMQTLNSIADTKFVLIRIILPLGISFFTFEQISYLVDIYRGMKYSPNLLRYALFVSFFPRLVAGPILRYGEIAGQFGERRVGLDDLVDRR